MLFFANLFGLAFGPIVRRCSVTAVIALYRAVQVVLVELVAAVVLEMISAFNDRSASTVVVVA